MWEIMKHFKISSLSHPQVPSPESGASAPWMYTWRGPCQRDRSGWWISRSLRAGDGSEKQGENAEIDIHKIGRFPVLFSGNESMDHLLFHSVTFFPGKLGRRGIDKQCWMLHESWKTIEGNVLAERTKKDRRNNWKHLQYYIRLRKFPI